MRRVSRTLRNVEHDVNGRLRPSSVGLLNDFMHLLEDFPELENKDLFLQSCLNFN